jgi:hypothetical protein
LGGIRLAGIITSAERNVAAFQPDLCDLCGKAFNEVILPGSFR